MIPASAPEKVTRESDHVGPTSRGGKKVRWTRGAPHLPCAPSPDAVHLESDGWRSERLGFHAGAVGFRVISAR